MIDNEEDDMVDTTLLERLIERAVEARMAEMRGALWVHTHLLTELIKQLPKETVLQAALLIDQTWLDLSPPEREVARATQDQWRTFLAQRGGLVEGETRPEFPLGARKLASHQQG